MIAYAVLKHLLRFRCRMSTHLEPAFVLLTTESYFFG